MVRLYDLTFKLESRLGHFCIQVLIRLEQKFEAGRIPNIKKTTTFPIKEGRELKLDRRKLSVIFSLNFNTSFCFKSSNTANQTVEIKT